MLIALPIVDWWAVYALRRVRNLSLREYGRSPVFLTERYGAALVIAGGSTAGAVFGLAYLTHALTGVGLLVILAVALFLPSMANALWLYRALHGDFGR
jgi:hypothetical protein